MSANIPAFPLGAYSADFQSRTANVLVTAAGLQLCRPDPSRIFLGVYQLAANFFVGPPGVVYNTSTLYALVTGGEAFTLWWDRHGPLVQQEWWGITQAGSCQVGVMELYYRPVASVFG